VRKTCFVVLMTILLSGFAVTADTYYQAGKVVKWENGTYPQGDHKTKAWIVYQVQSDKMFYSIARHKETKPKMEPGEQLQFRVKGTQMTVVNAQGKKTQYQIIGQSEATGQ